MNPIIWSPFNDKGQFVTDLGFVALAIDFPLRLVLPFVAIAASWKGIYIKGLSIMIQFTAAEGRPEGKYKVVLVIRSVLKREVSFYACHVMSK